MKHLMFCSMVSTSGQISHNNRRKDTSATKQVPSEVLFVRNKAKQKIVYRAAREILKFPIICRYIVKNKVIFGPLLIAQLVWYILKQLFTSVAVKVMDIYFHFNLVNKCAIFGVSGQIAYFFKFN